jgi:hypothetical protein
MMQKVGQRMKIARKAAVAVVAALLSVGLLGISAAPAQADTWWGIVKKR